MLKASVSYSKKVPVEGKDYSSQGYSLTLETEIPDQEPAAIQRRLHDTFDLVKASVESELANGKSAKPEPAEPRRPEKPGDNAKASNKQLKFITDLAGRKGIGFADLNAGIRKRFGADDVYGLTRRQASELLDALNGRAKAA